MTEDAIKRAIATAVRETVQLMQRCARPADREAVSVHAREYAEQIIMPVVIAAMEQAHEDGFQEGRTARIAAAS